MTGGSTIELRTEDSLYLRLENVLKELPPTARLTTDLNALFKISRVISSIRDVEELQRKLLELIAEVVPADDGALLMVGENLGEFASVVSWKLPDASALVVPVTMPLNEIDTVAGFSSSTVPCNRTS